MKISIIVPVFNVEKYVGRCIDSILNQDYKNLELILVDDGSTDRSGIICDQYKNDSRVKVFHQENQGVSSARNLGLENSVGGYLLFLDADDWLADNALFKLISNCNDADLIMFGAYNYILLEDGSYKLTKRVNFCGKRNPFPANDKYKDIFDKSAVLWNKMIKREVISDLRFNMNIRYGEDADFLCRVLNNVDSAYIVPTELYYYFNNRLGNVISAQIDDRSFELIEGTKTIYDILVRNSDTTSGFIRIFNVANEVISKIPVTFESVNNNIDYLRAIVSLLRYPPFKERLLYYFNRDFSKRVRIRYFCMQFAQLYMYCRVLKKKLKSII